jgi:hypothetical protein
MSRLDDTLKDHCQTPMSEPARNLIAGVIGQAVADIKDPRFRKSAAIWMLDADGTCPAYCAAIDIDYGRFHDRIKQVLVDTRVRAPRKVKPTKRGRLRKSQRIAAHAARAQA